MTTKNIKIRLFASLVVATLIFTSLSISAEAEQEKDYRNYESETIYEELAPYLIEEIDVEKDYSQNDLDEINRLKIALDRAQNDHREKFKNDALMNELKNAHQLISDSNIPFLILGITNDKLVIQLSADNSKYETKIADNSKYETKIAEMLEGVPYSLEYGEGAKRGACAATTDNCDPEQGE